MVMDTIILHQDVMRLATESCLDPRTTRRAIQRGVGALRAATDRERFTDALRRLGWSCVDGQIVKA